MKQSEGGRFSNLEIKDVWIDGQFVDGSWDWTSAEDNFYGTLSESMVKGSN